MHRSTDRIYDEYLAAAARAGDRTALARLAVRWDQKLLRHAWRLTGDHDLALDLAQEAWRDIVERIGGLQDSACFPAWAYRIVTRRCADEIRRRQRHRRGQAALQAEPAAVSVSHQAIETSADMQPVQQAISALPAEQRATVALFYSEDMSVAEIAAALNVPAGTVKTRLKAAREKLRAALEVTQGGAS